METTPPVRVVSAAQLRGEYQFASADERTTRLKLDVALVRDMDPGSFYWASLTW